MSSFISVLESRTFLSAAPITKVTLTADKAAITSDAAAVKADLNLLIKNNTLETDAIAKDFKGLPPSDDILLKTLVTEETESRAIFLKQTAALDTPAVALAGKSASIGASLLSKATVKSLATASLDITALSAVTTVPLANLDAHLLATGVPDALSAIITAQPADAALDAAVNTQLTNSSAEKLAIGSSATQLGADVANLASDLLSVHIAVGTFPSIVGIFSGTAHETSGKNAGQTDAATLTIISESSDGILTGSVTNFLGGVDPLVGSVSLNGVVALKAAPHTGTVTIAGTLTGATLTGKFAFASGKGTFAVTEGD